MDYQLTFEDDPAFVRLKGAWERAMTHLEETMTKPQFLRFIAPLRPRGREGNLVFVNAPGQFLVSWVKKNFQRRIEEGLSDEIGEKVKIELIAEPKLKPASSAPVAAAEPLLPEPPRFSDRFTFENFVVGQSNRLAHAGAFEVAQTPGKRFNPLFIYGGSGLGKTHLLHAIANEARAREPSLIPTYVTGQQFTENFVGALQHGRIEQFRRLVRAAGIWLVDDVHGMQGRDKTQEELFHSFNQLQQDGKQIVFTCDRSPRDLYFMDERLRSRFECGLVADVMPPDTETRASIVRRKAEVEGLELPADICEYLAINVPGNVRTLEGALTKLVAQASFNSLALSVELAAEIVQNDYPPAASHRPSFERIVDEVCSYYEVSRRELLGPSRKADIAHARHVGVYFARKLTGDSWKRLGEKFGNRDHTSMIHADRKISELATKDLETQTELRDIERRLGPAF